ncbi:sugar ABC transporter substrate-binding protein [Clostridium sp. MSJ-11]|uniref:Sugar ABC transporter substrate-binding protein n=1 Tax=Clostridium mobile TaxID=2841512 RepID=A0ABS6EGD0_9CLOT|nr:sugar ABC transporter substrate-binding protein [Clostridium mobile]MBU5484055.1 sugar ABC transporter substrate-binding protein [Clostridium mobile]
MKKNIKIIPIILAIVMIMGMVGCSSQQTDSKEAGKDKKYKIAVLLPGPTGYFVATKEGIDKAAKEHNVEIEYADAQWDASKQMSQVEDYIAKKVDLIALCSVDAIAAEKAVKAANDAKIPMLAFTNAIGTDPTGKYDGLVSYVGQNEVRTGELCAKIAKKMLGEKGGNVVLIEGRPGTNPQRNRREGFLQEIKDTPNIKVVYTQTSNWEKEQALKITEDLIQKKTQFDLIFCQDDNSATGAGQALKEAEMKDKVKVIGLGGSKDGLQAIKDKTIDATTYMSAVEEGALAIETAVKYLKGEKVEPVTEIMQVEVNESNVDTFKGEW